MPVQNFVAGAVPLHHAGRAARGQVIHPPDPAVGVVDQVRIAVPGGDEDVVDPVVGPDHVPGQLEGHQRGAAALLHVKGPGPGQPQFLLDFGAHRPVAPFLDLFAAPDDQVDVLRVEARIVQSPAGRLEAHGRGAVSRAGHVFLVPAQLGPDDLGRGVALGSDEISVVISPGDVSGQAQEPGPGQWVRHRRPPFFCGRFSFEPRPGRCPQNLWGRRPPPERTEPRNRGSTGRPCVRPGTNSGRARPGP